MRSRANAIKDGLTAETVLLPHEDPEVFQYLLAAIFAEFAPDGAFEEVLVERIASLLWRLRRVPAIESALFRWVHAKKKSALIKDLDDPLDLPLTLGDTDDRDGLEMGRTYEALLNSGNIDRLGRCETNLQRKLSQTIEQLREAQSARRGRSNEATAVDIEPEPIADNDRGTDESDLATAENFHEDDIEF
jgi:hypothetical protein